MNCVYRRECELVVDLIISQEGVPQTRQSVFEISSNAGIHRLSVGHIIHDLYTVTHPEENIVPLFTC